MIIIFLSLLTVMSLILALLINKDLFSPSKFYLLSLVVYFFDIFISEQSEMVYFVYTVFMGLGIIFIFIEKKMISNRFSYVSNQNKPFINEKKILIILWIISCIPILAQLYIVFLMGGFYEYMISLKLRVVEWKGLGYILMLKQIYPIVNIMYFLLGVIFNIKKKKLWWGLFLVHLSIMIGMGLLSGSRGSALFGIVYIIIMGHYYIKHISMHKAITIILGFILIAAFLGNLRNTFTYSDEGLNLNNQNSKISDMHLIRYGINPLNIIFYKEFTDYQYGLTFVSAITNFVPRTIWPGKPDTGGVVLTRYRAGASYYTGTSNYSPGILAESILNFGYSFGPIVAVLILFIVFLLSISIYKKFLLKLSSANLSLDKLKISYYYLLALTIPGGLLYGEFTNIFMNLLLKIIMFFGLFLVINQYLSIRDTRKI